MTGSENEFYYLPRLGWMLYEDINRRLGILIEECLHLQQVVHYYGGFDVGKKEQNEYRGGGQPEQRKMEHFKQIPTKDYLRYPPTTRAMLALYEHLGALTIGLKSHQTEVRTRFESFLSLTQRCDENSESWFWFVALRGHLLHEIIGWYMDNLEHAHEKLIQILETKPGILPQPILLRRWNSALHGRFLSEYSRHVAWETNLLFNNLKAKKLSDEALKEKRHYSTFIHSWAHTPTSMVGTFKIKDKNFNKKPIKEDEYQLGSIRSAFFYLEMPQLYPLLFHECAHLEFDWDSEAKRNDQGTFFTSRKAATDSLEESAQQLRWNREGFWDNFTEEIWIDTIAVNLGGVPYLTALTLQIFGQSSGCFFLSDPEIPLQDWAIKPIYDLEQPSHDQYFWEARLNLAMNWLENVRAEECAAGMNKQWLTAIKQGIEAYRLGGQAIFSAKRTSSQHENWWGYRSKVNRWVYDTTRTYQEQNTDALNKGDCKKYSEKYWISKGLFKEVIKPVVQKFENTFFEPNECHYGEEGDFSLETMESITDLRRIEYIPFHIKWYLSKKIMKELFKKNHPQTVQTFTFAYANYIRSDGGGAFRIALEWIMARNELNQVFADYLEDPETIEPYMEKLKKVDKDSRLLDDYLSLAAVHSNASQMAAKENLALHLRYQDSYNVGCAKVGLDDHTTKISKQLEQFINQFMTVQVENQLCEAHKDGARIGTCTLGVLAKHQINDDKNLPYLCLASKVHDYYKEILEGLDHPENLVSGATMPLDYSSGDNLKKPFSYVAKAAETTSNKPTRTGLHFITGDYDFIRQQYEATPGEMTFHPQDPPAMLTKSRTVLDLLFPRTEAGKSDKLHPEGGNLDKPRQPWGRISLVKFRYRWEMYRLSMELKAVEFRARLMLSSAWEDGILITWHKSPGELWTEGFNNKDYGTVYRGTMDAQTSLFLFKFIQEKEKNVAKSCDAKRDISIEDPISANAESVNLGQVIKDLVAKGIFKNSTITTGRFDYVVEWHAKDPDELASALSRLPAEFWQNIGHINTTFRHQGMDKKDGVDKLESPSFVSEIGANMFLQINVKKKT